MIADGKHRTELNENSLIGIGLRSPYMEYFLNNTQCAEVSFLEVHPENFLYNHDAYRKLKAIAKDYSISFHFTSLSLGSPSLLENKTLSIYKQFIEDINPILVSDHLSWGALEESNFMDLYPLPYTKESLHHIAHHIDKIQNLWQRPILIENPSSYLEFANNDYTEVEFLNALAQKTGCGILLDLNNIAVQAYNHKKDTQSYLEDINWDSVYELHLAGHTYVPQVDLKIDTHDQLISEEVWNLYKTAQAYKKNIPTLIEWDKDFPPLNTILKEAKKAQDIQGVK